MASPTGVIFFLVIFILSFYCMYKLRDEVSENKKGLYTSAVFFFVSIIGMILSYLGT